MTKTAKSKRRSGAGGGGCKERKIGKVMHEYKSGSLGSGKAHAPVKSRAQAIAIGLSEARKRCGSRKSRAQRKK